MRIRSIKPEFWTSDDVAQLDHFTRLLFIGLWSYCDDYGRGRDEEHLIIAALFPRDMFERPRETVANVRESLARLQEASLIVRYTSGGRRYLSITGWSKHQRVDKPRPSLIPPCEDADGEDFPQNDAIRETVANVRESLATPPDTLAPGTGEQGNRGTGEQGNTPLLATLADPPQRGATRRGTRLPDDWTPSDTLAAWTRQHAPAAANETEIEKFRDYWKAQPGAKGRKLDWDATWRNWARRTQENTSRQNNGYRTQAQIVQDMRAQAAAATKGNALALIQGGSP